MFFNLAGFLTRVKYYTAWKMSEGACCLTGIDYLGTDKQEKKGDTSPKKHKWGRVANISILNVELPENPRMMMGEWNINTQRWLKNHVYLRFIREDGRNSGQVTMLTYLTSAFWHGFHPGFYLSFGFAALETMTGRWARRYLRPIFLQDAPLQKYKKLYDILGTFCSWTMTNFLMAPFVLLTVKTSLASWSSMFYYQHFAMIAIIWGFKYLGINRRLEKLGAPKKLE